MGQANTEISVGTTRAQIQQKKRFVLRCAVGKPDNALPGYVGLRRLSQVEAARSFETGSKAADGCMELSSMCDDASEGAKKFGLEDARCGGKSILRRSAPTSQPQGTSKCH